MASVPADANASIAAEIPDPAPTEVSQALTPPQLKSLREIRLHLLKTNQFDPRRHSDHMLVRFLRARDFDFAATQLMLDNYEKWRKEFNVDQIVRSFNFEEADKVRELYPQYYHGVDNQGRPVYIESYSRLDVGKLQKVSTNDRLTQRLVYEYERMLDVVMPGCSIANGSYVGQSCTILDLNGVSLFSFIKVKYFLGTITSIAQNYYPEVLGNLYIINPGSSFSTIFRFVSGFLPEATVKKIAVVEKADVATTLLKNIPPENVPVAYGGACKCAEGADAKQDKTGATPCEALEKGPWLSIPKEQINAELERRVAGLDKWAAEAREKLGIPQPAATADASQPANSTM